MYDKNRMMEILKALDTAQQKLDAVKKTKEEPIAIIGMSCRFPGAKDLGGFWELLQNSADAISDVPENRWNIENYSDEKIHTNAGGFLDQVDQFDAQFFDMSPKEAQMLDPQQRLLLEVTVEALENAHQPLETLSRSKTGVFVAISSFDYAYRIQRSGSSIDANLGTGTLASPAAGRISYFLGAQGPSMVIDTACSSSLVAIHQAINGLRNQEMTMALVGGVSVIADPNLTIAFSRAGMLSPDSRCKTFDADANGYVRSEGCGVVVLKRYSDAVRDGDSILALIKGSAVNQDGASGGLTIPNGPAQEAVIQQALRNANLQSKDINYIEAHGTGTSLGDPIEVNALGQVFSERDTPLLIGSVKTNIGHAEAAAGMASLIKVVLALQQEKIPANLHFNQPNPHIPWKQLPISVCTQKTPWPRSKKERIAGISAFGFSGTNAHLIVTEAPFAEPHKDYTKHYTTYLFTLSAKTPSALDAQVTQYLHFLTLYPNLALADVCLTTNLRRTHFKERLALTATSISEIKEKLMAYQARKNVRGMYRSLEEPELAKTPLHFDNDWDKQLDKIAHAYIAGEKIPWEHDFANQHYNPIALPTYPWQKTSYWIDIMNNHSASTSAAAFVHPLLQKRLNSSTITNGQIVFESMISIDDLPYLSQHDIYDKAIFLGAGYVEMALAAAVERFHLKQFQYETPLVLQELMIKQMLILSKEHQASLVQVILTPNDQGYSFKIMSLSHDREDSWIEHMQGQIAPPQQRQPSVTQFDLSALKKKVHQPIDTREYYQLFASMGVNYGPAFKVLNMLWHDPDSGDVLAWIELPETIAGASHYYCNPLITDGCFQLLAAALQIKNDDEKLYYVLRLEHLLIAQRPQTKLWCYARLTNDHQEAGLLTSFDLYLINEQGVVVGEMLNLQTHRAGRNAFLSQVASQWYYETVWQPRQLTHKDNTLVSALHEPKNWLIFADQTGLSTKVVAFLTAHTQRCTVVTVGETFKQLQDGHYQINGAQQDDFQHVLAGTTYQHIVHFWGLDKTFNPNETTLTASTELTTGLLHLVQALVKTYKKHPPRLSIVTRQAQAVMTTQQEIEQATLWGFGRVLTLEHAELKPLLVDIDESVLHHVQNLVQEIVLAEREQQVVLRRSERYVARLKHALVTEKKTLLKIDSNASYLITGGLGGLGLQIAHHLVGLGARHLLLISRTGAATPEAQAEIKRLEDRNVTVTVVAGDISEIGSLSDLSARINGSLRGIIHTAGVLDDGMMMEQSAQRFKTVMAPKIQGTWNLHQLTQSIPLDFFVCFSSMTSVIGAIGQANYAAANAFMDAFCHYRHAKGLPALSINWGPWNSPGMAANDHLRHHWDAIGMGMITPEQGVDIFGHLLNLQTNQMGVIDMEWSKYPDESTFFEYLKPASAHKNVKAANIIHQLNSAQGEPRRKLLIRYIEDQVCHILGYDAGQSFRITQGFFDLGINSLTSMEFRNNLQHDLGCRLPSTLVFDYPTIKKLVDYLLAEVLNDEEHNDGVFSASSPATQDQSQDTTATDSKRSQNAAQALAEELGISWE